MVTHVEKQEPASLEITNEFSPAAVLDGWSTTAYWIVWKMEEVLSFVLLCSSWLSTEVRSRFVPNIVFGAQVGNVWPSFLEHHSYQRQELR